MKKKKKKKKKMAEDCLLRTLTDDKTVSVLVPTSRLSSSRTRLFLDGPFLSLYTLVPQTKVFPSSLYILYIYSEICVTYLTLSMLGKIFSRRLI